MGVKDLWQILSPVCERKSLWELQDKTIAVDLSCWVCDSQNVAEFTTQPNMYLRNLFFRTSALLLLGAHPIFVLDGDAPLLKANVMDQRNAARGFTLSQKEGSDQSNKGKRKHYKSVQKKCCELLDCMGIKYVQSEGEAEALCALLNKHGLVDGCISQDSDCFLYGAKLVYRNFTTTANSSTGGPGFSVDSYNMTSVEKSLGLTRNKLIALSLLCGCDYLQQGVAGVGKESALKFIATVEDDAVLDRLRKWRHDFYFEQLEEERSVGGCEQCGHIGKKKVHMSQGCSYCQVDKGCTPSFNPWSLCQMDVEKRKLLITELTIRKKALLDPNFPSEDIIDEFLRPNVTVPSELNSRWEQPNLVNFLRLAVRFLRWEENYAFDKFLPILTRWVLLRKGEAQNMHVVSCPVIPVEIKRARVLRGIASYEVKWGDTEGLFDSILAATNQDSQAESTDPFCTIEPKRLVEEAYPELVNKFITEREEARRAKRKGKSKSKKVEKPLNEEKKCDKCGGHEGCLCRFAQARDPKVTDKENEPVIPQCPKKKETKPKTQKRKPRETTDAKQKRLSSFFSEVQTETAPMLRDIPLEELFDTSLNLQDFTDDYDEADLSAIVMSIVGGEDRRSEIPETSADGDRSKKPVSVTSSPGASADVGRSKKRLSITSSPGASADVGRSKKRLSITSSPGASADVGRSKKPVSITSSPGTSADVEHCKRPPSINDSPGGNDVNCQSVSSSDEEIETYLPLMERIRMRNRPDARRRRLEAELSSTDSISSPVCKRPKSDHEKLPYSPLVNDFLPDSPAPNKRRSILKSEAARRFSASIEAFSRHESTSMNETLRQVRMSSGYDEISHTNRFSLGISRLLDGDESV